MDAQEFSGIETRFKAATGLAKQVNFAADMEAQVITRGLSPINFPVLQEEAPPGRFDDQPIQEPSMRLNVFQESAVLTHGLFPLVQLLAGSLQRLLQAAAIKRLEQIIHGVDFESTKGVAVVGGHEDGGRYILRSDRFQDAEAV